MMYATLSFNTLRKLYDLHTQMAMEYPEALTECDHMERHELALELDRRLAKGEHL
jgi:hypothetical protein